LAGLRKIGVGCQGMAFSEQRFDMFGAEMKMVRRNLDGNRRFVPAFIFLDGHGHGPFRDKMAR
jgi:hypothetical protein